MNAFIYAERGKVICSISDEDEGREDSVIELSNINLDAKISMITKFIKGFSLDVISVDCTGVGIVFYEVLSKEFNFCKKYYPTR